MPPLYVRTSLLLAFTTHVSILWIRAENAYGYAETEMEKVHSWKNCQIIRSKKISVSRVIIDTLCNIAEKLNTAIFWINSSIFTIFYVKKVYCKGNSICYFSLVFFKVLLGMYIKINKNTNKLKFFQCSANDWLKYLPLL